MLHAVAPETAGVKRPSAVPAVHVVRRGRHVVEQRPPLPRTALAVCEHVLQTHAPTVVNRADKSTARPRVKAAIEREGVEILSMRARTRLA